MQAARVVLVGALLLSIPRPRDARPVASGDPPPIDAVRLLLIDSVLLDSALPESGQSEPGSIADRVTLGDHDDHGLWALQDDAGNTLGSVARTLPTAQDVVGYRGPTEALILFDPDLVIVAVDVLNSADTTEHVAAVRDDAGFLNQFAGWAWGGPSGDVRIDGVSGATLTSLAMAQGVMRRIGGDRPSLVFPDEITADEREEWIQSDDTASRLVRTGPLSDKIIGYQGPTELLLRLRADDRVEKLAIRHSFDNEPYVDYVRTERSFWKRFEGQSLDELSRLDPQAAGIEGVSGATMTSMAVADTLVAAAAESVRRQKMTSESAKRNAAPWVRWTMADGVTIGILLIAGIASRWGWFRSRWGRMAWLISVVVVIGFWAGNLVSMALVAGWATEGIAWRLAPGLAAIAAVALLVPPLTKANPYCNHLCPHGALQQLVRPKPKSRRHLRLSRRTHSVLTWGPGVTLVIAYLALLAMPTLDLASWEPFHAYLVRIAGWGSIGLALLTIAVSALVPMAYCRVGCPTGRLIEYLRLRATSHRWGPADTVACGLLSIAWAVRWL
ncbi:Electron transport complex subunit RsxG [Rubripirellula lacrimiformis]|uniref:Electron transport complex subunit RsxG n=1 Tax=Rubripirellula lacrimiformis TaxID=1930273 RepID=A0A517N8G8_9BACT|nr:FMN-binding protein [Rubripirellula lacrimiformis]QDT03298.1 Electron transport complex subunit RsxG [Rubripirellula lacrimiformis]